MRQMHLVLYKVKASGMYQEIICIKLFYKLEKHFVILKIQLLNGQIKIQKKGKYRKRYIKGIFGYVGKVNDIDIVLKNKLGNIYNEEIFFT